MADTQFCISISEQKTRALFDKSVVLLVNLQKIERYIKIHRKKIERRAIRAQRTKK